MNTAFGKFVSGKFFDKLFLLFLLAGTVFMACAKGSAVRGTYRQPLACQALSVFFYLAAGILITGQRKISAKMADRNVDLLLGFATCFFIYDFFLSPYLGDPDRFVSMRPALSGPPALQEPLFFL